MAYLLAYTKKGEGCYPDFNYPGHVGYNCDWEQAMHLALSEDGKNFTPLRNNTGILFAKASFEEDEFVGVTKTLVDPWICCGEDGIFYVLAVRRNQKHQIQNILAACGSLHQQILFITVSLFL